MSEIKKVPLLWYNPKIQTEQVIGIVHCIQDGCFDATLFDTPYTDIFYKYYDAETFEVRAIILDNKEE